MLRNGDCLNIVNSLSASIKNDCCHYLPVQWRTRPSSLLDGRTYRQARSLCRKKNRHNKKEEKCEKKEKNRKEKTVERHIGKATRKRGGKKNSASEDVEREG